MAPTEAEMRYYTVGADGPEERCSSRRKTTLEPGMGSSGLCAGILAEAYCSRGDKRTRVIVTGGPSVWLRRKGEMNKPFPQKIILNDGDELTITRDKVRSGGKVDRTTLTVRHIEDGKDRD